MIIGGVWNRID